MLPNSWTLHDGVKDTKEYICLDPESGLFENSYLDENTDFLKLQKLTQTQYVKYLLGLHKTVQAYYEFELYWIRYGKTIENAWTKWMEGLDC